MVVGYLGTIPKNRPKRLGEQEKNNHNHPDDSTVKTISDTQKIAGDLRRLAVTHISLKNWQRVK